MRSRWFLPGLLLVLLSSGATRAEPLTCEAFRDRLNGALLTTGTNAEAVDFRKGFSSPVRGTRYDWTGTALNGTLNCGPADQFEEFGIELHFRSRDTVAEAFQKLKVLQGASLCALSSDGAPVCMEFARVMLQEALEGMGRAFNRGATAPSGISDRTLAGGIQVEVTSAPTLITFVAGPGRGETVDAVRQPLPAPGGKAAE